ncbi:phage regulatory protein Rha [Haemophilus influenzae]|nr:phage regulatory protein Rha [Haemophilus influenzae]PRL72681.1 phage regulatory protein Rha [Haemophilus influenzae]
MNQLLTISKENTSTLTMSSREIAELINKNHSDLCRSIERLIAKEVIWGISQWLTPIHRTVRLIMSTI